MTLKLAFQNIYFRLLLLFLTMSSSITGQIMYAGRTPLMHEIGSSGAYELDFENINLFNGKITFTFPLASSNGRGNADLDIYQNINNGEWKINVLGGEGWGPVYNIPEYINESNMPSFGRLYQKRATDECGETYGYARGITRIIYKSPNGTETEFVDSVTGGTISQMDCEIGSLGINRRRVFYATDGSGATFVSDLDVVDYNYPSGDSGIAGVLYLKNGVKWRFSGASQTPDWIIDENGNRTTFNITTSPAYAIEIANSNGQIVKASHSDVEVKKSSTITKKTTIHRAQMGTVLATGYQLGNLATLFPDTTGGPLTGSGYFNPTVISQIELPDGKLYKFFYNDYGEVARVETPTGVAIEYEYGATEFECWTGGLLDIGYVGIPGFGSYMAQTITRRINSRRIYNDGGTGNSFDLRTDFGAQDNPNNNDRWAHVVQYIGNGTAQGIQHSISQHKFYGTIRLGTQPSGQSAFPFWRSGREYETVIYGADISIPLRKITREWAQASPFTGIDPYERPHNVRLIQTTTLNYETNQQNITKFLYDNFNNITDSFEYDFAIGGIGSLLKRTHTDYISAYDYISENGSHIRHLPSQTWVSSDVAGNNKVSLTTFEYDNYANDSNHAALISRSNVIGHDSTNFGTGFTKRGNLTATTTYADAQNQTGGITTYAQYDILGNVVKTIDAKGTATTISYNDNFGIADNEATTNTAPVSLGGLYTFAYPTSTTNTLGWTGYTQYDYFTGAPVNTQDVNGIITKTLYNDLLDRPTQTFTAVGTPLESQSKIIYDDANRRIEATSDLNSLNDNLIKSESFYDGLGRTIENRSYKDGSYIAVKTEYDALGRVKQVTNPYRPHFSETPVWSKTKYDSLSRVIEVETPDGSKSFTAYSGNRTLAIDAAGKQRISVSNALGQLKQIWEITASDGATEAVTFPGYPSITHGYKTDYNYDTLGNLVTVNQGIQTRTFAYNSLSRLVSATNPESGTINYSYDNNGNLTSKTDARSVTTSYIYDALNRITQRSYSGETGFTTPAVSYFYDNLPNAKGKLTKVANSVSTTEYTSFDILGRVTGHKQTTDGQGYSTGYAYNLSGALVEQTYPSGRVVENVIDNNGDLSMVQSGKCQDGTLPTNGVCINLSGLWNYARNFTYNSAGAVISMQLGNGRWESTQFNSRLQPTQIALGATNGATDLLKLDYSYGTTNNNGNVLSQTITVPTIGINAGFVAIQQYNYDQLNRLKAATEMISAVESWKQTFNYDRFGNRIFDEELTSTLPKACTVSNIAVICTNDRKILNPFTNQNNNTLSDDDVYQYDPSGNLIRDPDNKIYSYDAQNKQRQVRDINDNVIGTYFYDGDGRRIKKISDLESTAFIYDAFGNLIAEYLLEGQSTNPAPQTQYLLYDTLGSTRVVTNQNGDVISRRDFHPFGEEIAANENNRKAILGYGIIDNRYGFTGYEKDLESNLEFAQNRYYANLHGRFTSVDPLMASGKVRDPQSWNRYIYARNNPLNLIDPSGLCPPEDDTPCDDDGNPIIEETYVEIHISDEEVYIGIGPFEYNRQFSPKPKQSWWNKIKNWFGFDSSTGTPTIPTIPSPGPVEPGTPDGQSPDIPDSTNPDVSNGSTPEEIALGIGLMLAQKYIDELLNGRQLEDGYIYRLGRETDRQITPRPLKDINGLSASLDRPQGGEYLKLDVQKLRAAGLLVINDHSRHVAIVPRTAKELAIWMASRGIYTHPFTQAVRNSVVEKHR